MPTDPQLPENDAIDAVWYRHHTAERQEFASIDEALRFLDSGEDYFELSAVGVFVNGEPRFYGSTEQAPTPKQVVEMRAAWREARDDD